MESLSEVAIAAQRGQLANRLVLLSLVHNSTFRLARYSTRQVREVHFGFEEVKILRVERWPYRLMIDNGDPTAEDSI